MKISKKQSRVKVQLSNSKVVDYLVDTNSDITIIKESDWPSSRAFQTMQCDIKEVGSTMFPAFLRLFLLLPLLMKNKKAPLLKRI